ncbi:NAD-dependent epimerase/dehydratase family protein [Pedobacter frigiditerrae]|uniref:NAD-dependent epimerase/dehydratase family protein n=1 Tax=Pedobacter frigiditerrae TaxID=2530452 RepID=UPI00292E3AD3|nr:NAD-dependent epimerase/dehydratase family protein [Pedobacter frigiditerrae]
MTTLLTGASGFLGKYIFAELSSFSEVITLSRNGSVINTDLTKKVPDLPELDLVIHAAGKAHVMPKNAVEKKQFFDVNLTGTNNLLKGLERSGFLPHTFVLISTVAVYGLDTGHLVDESAKLEAKDPYGQSKIQAEQLVLDWCKANNVIVSILRLPLLVGENPPGNLGAMINGIKHGYYFNIAGGKAKKSMVFASDVAKLIPMVAEIGGVYNVTDGYHPSFFEIAEVIAKQLDKKKPLNIPLWLARTVAIFGNLIGNKAPINSHKLNKITSELTFDDRKIRSVVNWKPHSVATNFKVK